jgi:type IV secretory pathway VirJ component
MRGIAARKNAKGTGYVLAPFAALSVPWIVLQGEVDRVCAPGATREFVTATGSGRLFALPEVGHGFSVSRRWDAQYVQAYQSVAAAPRPAPAEVKALPGLSVEEVPARGASDRDLFAVILTGDGGWAEIDKEIADALAGAGIPVVGWSSLRYYWTPRRPEEAAGDLARIVEHYAAAWTKPRAILVGYSFGAAVLPFLVNRLSAETRARVERVALLAPTENAAFAFHVASWLGGGGESDRPVRPEVEHLGVPVLCVEGGEEAGSPCRGLGGAHVEVASVGRGHHFGGEYNRIAELILGHGIP